MQGPLYVCFTIWVSEGSVNPGTQAAETLVPSLSSCVAVGVHSAPELAFDGHAIASQKRLGVACSFRARSGVG